MLASIEATFGAPDGGQVKTERRGVGADWKFYNRKQITFCLFFEQLFQTRIRASN